MFKKLFSILTGVLLIFSISITAMAAQPRRADTDISLNYVNINSASSTLSISNGIATIKSYVTKTTSGQSIYLQATLQKYSGGSWSNLCSWSTSSTSSTAYLSQTNSVASGTYRVATNYSVSGAGGTESSTLYSNTVTC